MGILMLVTMFAFVMAGLPTHAEDAGKICRKYIEDLESKNVELDKMRTQLDRTRHASYDNVQWEIQTWAKEVENLQVHYEDRLVDCHHKVDELGELYSSELKTAEAALTDHIDALERKLKKTEGELHELKTQCKNQVSECTKTHEGGCANYNKVVLARFRENDFNISTCLTKCRTNTRCEGFALGKNQVRGKCILYKSDDQGNECINDKNKNWDYYSMKNCSGKA